MGLVSTIVIYIFILQKILKINKLNYLIIKFFQEFYDQLYACTFCTRINKRYMSKVNVPEHRSYHVLWSLRVKRMVYISIFLYLYSRSDNNTFYDHILYTFALQLVVFYIHIYIYMIS